MRIVSLLAMLLLTSCGLVVTPWAPFDVIGTVDPETNVVHVDWEAVFGATSYDVQVFDFSIEDWRPVATDIADSEYSHSYERETGTVYERDNALSTKFRVRSADFFGRHSEWSDELTVGISIGYEPNPIGGSEYFVQLVDLGTGMFRIEVSVIYTGTVTLDELSFRCWTGVSIGDTAWTMEGWETAFAHTPVHPGDQILAVSDPFSDPNPLDHADLEDYSYTFSSL